MLEHAVTIIWHGIAVVEETLVVRLINAQMTLSEQPYFRYDGITRQTRRMGNSNCDDATTVNCMLHGIV